ncbi:MAG TPA: GAF domain-containing sensor histidine kinase [Thermoanaerobaculia bacterium]|nr:GAF domain-containing sensor histidine kinase [Thermoanaerobaculia bacterium]
MRKQNIEALFGPNFIEFGAIPAFSYPSLMMTLRQLKLVATITPVLALIAIELARHFVIGELALWQRLVLDGVAVAAIIIFSAIIFRFVGQLQGTVERRNRELLALHGAGLDVASELSLEIVLRKVVEQAAGLLGTRYGALSVIDREGTIQEFITFGVTEEERAAIGPPPVGHGVLGVVLHEGHSLRLSSVAAHPRSVGFPENHPVMRSLLAVPITCKSPFRGNIYVSEKTAGSQFTDDDQETLERFAVQAGIAIDNAHLHAQAAEIATAQERLRIAHEMHDGLAQVLGYVNTKVQAAKQYLRNGRAEEASTQLDELAISAREAYGDVREAIVGLRTLPGSDRNLTEVLDEFLHQWKDQSGVSTELNIDPDLRLQTSVELQLVRIIQESLTNVRKHARARVVRVDVHRHNGLLVASVTDDGVGFNPELTRRGEFPRFGLSTMRERATSIGGSLEIESSPGSGTTVRFTMPSIAAIAS